MRETLDWIVRILESGQTTDMRPQVGPIRVRRVRDRPGRSRRRKAGSPAGLRLAGLRLPGSGGARAPPGWRAQRSSDSTWDGCWLAWAIIAVPACCRTLARLMLAVSVAKSASMMRLRAAVWFSTLDCRFEMIES